MMLRLQLFVMIDGFKATAALKAAVVLTRAPDALAVFTGRRVTSGAVANTFADSPVPWPTASTVGAAVPGPSTVGSTR